MTRRIAIVSDAAMYVGPNVARLLAERGHDLVIGDPADGVVDELTALGATVEVVEGTRDLAKDDASERLVKAAIDRFGRIDSATAFTGRIVVGRFLRSSLDDLDGRAGGGELVDHAVGRVADHQVVAPFGEETSHVGPDVGGGVADVGDASCHGSFSMLICRSSPFVR